MKARDGQLQGASDNPMPPTNLGDRIAANLLHRVPKQTNYAQRNLSGSLRYFLVQRFPKRHLNLGRIRYVAANVPLVQE